MRWSLQPLQPFQKHNSNHLSVNQWIRSAIRDSQQPTSPIGFLFWNFRHRLVRYYWYYITLHYIILFYFILYYIFIFYILSYNIYIYIYIIYIYIHTQCVWIPMAWDDHIPPIASRCPGGALKGGRRPRTTKIVLPWCQLWFLENPESTWGVQGWIEHWTKFWFQWP